MKNFRELHPAATPCVIIATFPARMFSFAIIATVIFVLAPPLRAQGYVDPGAGAMIWQILAASFVGAIFLFRKFVLRWFRGSKNSARRRRYPPASPL